MSIDVVALRDSLGRGLGEVAADQLGTDLVRISIPNPRYLHDTVTVTVEQLADGGYRLTDAGEIAYTFPGNEALELLDLLHCSGSPIASDGGTAVHLVPTGGDLDQAVLSFAHALIAAPTLWNALQCRDEADQVVPRPTAESESKRMARRCRDRIVKDVPRASGFLHLDQLLRERADEARIPLAFTLNGPKQQPRLMASFIPEASRAQADAKSRNAWLWNIATNLTVPKFIVVADETQLEHFQDLFERDNVTTVSEADYDALSAEVDAQVTLAVSR